MKEKVKVPRAYHFNTLPFPPKFSYVEANNSATRMNNLLTTFREELHTFNERKGYIELGYKNMPSFIKARIQEISPRYANILLVVTKNEKSMGSSNVGEVPYVALALLKDFPVRIMKIIWKKSLSEVLTGESRIDVLKRVIRLRIGVDY